VSDEFADGDLVLAALAEGGPVQTVSSSLRASLVDQARRA
jgi:hypothetical protein